MASLAASTVQRGLSARHGPVRGSRRQLVVQNAVKEVFMPALSSTMTGRPRAGGPGGAPARFDLRAAASRVCGRPDDNVGDPRPACKSRLTHQLVYARPPAEGKIVSWLKSPGDKVKKGESIVVSAPREPHPAAARRRCRQLAAACVWLPMPAQF